MNKQFQGSKKAGRRAQMAKKQVNLENLERANAIIDDPKSSIKDIAEALGVKL